MKKLVKALCCSVVLVLAENVQSQDEITPVKLAGGIKIVRIGDQQPGIQGGIIYDNTTDTSAYLPIRDAGSLPLEYADDVILPDPSVGTAHVNGFSFGYYENGSNPFDLTINFYGALLSTDPLNPDDRPDQTSAVASLLLQGLPGDPMSSFLITVDLAGQGFDFDWPASVASDGSSINWMAFDFPTAGISGPGLLTATGGGSHDFFWSNKNFDPPYDTGMGGGGYLQDFRGHSPEASFHIQITGTVN
jgi:hypothetical protein